MTLYQKRMFKVIQLLDENIEHNLSLAQLSTAAHCSKFHFQRQFSAYFGLSPKQYSQQLKLKRAANQLVFHPQLSIGEIAYQAGFANSESFSRAFKHLVAQSPRAFRKQAVDTSVIDDLLSTPQLLTKMREYHMADNELEVSIIELPQIKLAVYQHHGSPSKVMQSVKHFITWRMNHHTPPSQSATFNLIYHDPNTVAEDEYRFDICAQTTNDIPKNDYGIINQSIPAGKYAKFRHIGSDQLLGASLEKLYGQWLPYSGYELRDFPCVLQRIAMYPQVAESSAITDILLPLA
ncbi:AraC family transcriptional regulator [Thalassotalea sp. G2M2-11]|uniref:AraC family transcriptional regulator n=1 Tax=Thalassotalea sp. G2M2-11 TaxID=2787627 RepID=UPI0019D28C0F|nr:AraC family transcriptional regulator [Thalassotalea sp. G2M2-11]